VALPFIPGFSANTPRLLDRFLPPLAEGVAAHYLQKHTRPGDIVFDPFGQSPTLAVEALALDRRVVVASFNPVSRLALSLAVRPPAIAELRAALTVLSDVPTGPGAADRLEPQVRALFRTRCAECETVTSADAFEWDAETYQPVEKFYYCAQCGGPRQDPTDDADRALANRYKRGGLDYHFLLERVTTAADPDRVHAEEALAVYTPRTLAAIGAVLVKVEALARDRETKRLLAGLLLTALDETTVLGQERPKTLTVPRRFREVNFWLALERAVGLVAGLPQPERSLTLTELLAPGAPAGIYAHAGNARELAALLPTGGVRLMLTAVPRPNQAYWTLSAVWASWLWGRDSAEALRAVLRRRRYDWAWHAKALQRTLAPLTHTLPGSGRLVGLLTEAEPGFNSSTLAAAAGAGFALDDAVLRADTAEAQYEWRAAGPAGGPEAPPDKTLQTVLRDGAIECLRARAEPTRWASLHLAAWRRLARLRLLAWQADEPLAAINRSLEQLVEQAPFVHLGAGAEGQAATGTWVLEAEAEAGEVVAPLADRVELMVARHLAQGEPVDEHELQALACQAFPGAQTPGQALVQACLASYAQRSESGLWVPRPEDDPAVRRDELRALEHALRGLGERCGFVVHDGPPQVWAAQGEPIFRLVVGVYATLGQYVRAAQGPARHRVLVVPGGRAGLAEFKLRRDARLRALLTEQGWLVVKFRQARRVAADDTVTANTAEAALAGDPLEAMQQLALLA
jgi:hypothetical protein